MKKLPVYLTTGLALLFTFSSCKRNDYEMKKETPVFSINQAKEWFANNLQTTAKSRTTNTASRLIDSLPPNNKTLLWKFAIQKKNSEVEAVELPYTGTAVVCELPDSSYTNNQQRNAIALGIAKRAVIYKKPNGAIELMLVHIVPSYDYLLTHPNHFKENYFLKLAADFTGWVYTYDWNDNPKSVSEIKNGKLKSGKTLFVKDSIAPQGTTNRWVTGYVQECGYAWVGVQNPYWCGQPGDPHYEDCINNSSTGGTGNWVYTCKWVLSQIWVPDPITGGGTGGQTGGSGTPPDDCNYYGTCDNNNQSANAFIIDSLNGYPCAQNVLQQLPNLNSETKRILSNVFNSSDDINLKFQVDKSLIGTTLDGHSRSSHYSNATFYSVIGLNPDVLNNSTQDYMIASFFHEVIHSYIDYKYNEYLKGNIDSNTFKNEFPIFWNPVQIPINQQEMAHHNEMAVNYVHAIASAIKSFNPNIDYSNAMTLAWGGLQKTTVWNMKTDNEKLMITEYGHIGRNISFTSPWYNMNYLNLSLKKCP